MPVKELMQRDRKMPVIGVRRKKRMRRDRTGEEETEEEERKKEEREQEVESAAGPTKTTVVQVVQVDFQSWP